METRVSRTLVAVAIALGLATPLLHAKKVEFPADDPAFTFTMPDDWTTETGKDGRVYCTAPAGFKIGIIASPGVSDADDARKLLTTVLKGMADAMKCENYKSEEAKTNELGKLSLVSRHGQCKSEGIEMALNAAVFALEPGKYFTIVGAAPEKVDKAHRKEMSELIRSIAAVE
ncbi:MAG TPA: hypothetical protein VEX43_14195 [Chthoniobacterales bacterium]|nr:hypothetical protein [Chthoniobacterales bacterium]